jgi:octanoyl-[GcvH]:protein N-octanoyltransferase
VLELSTQAWPDPAYDSAVSEALLHRVDTGAIAGSLRMFIPSRAVVFGRQDRARPGFAAAVAAARRAGYAPVLRLAGGRAAVFNEGTIAIAMAQPSAAPRETIADRFVSVSRAIRSALSTLGVDARVGEVEGEYCPGTYSVNAAGARKLAGIGQRLRRNAAHVGGVVVVEGADEVNRVLAPVYEALGYSFDPAATGAVADEVGAGVDTALAALIESFSAVAGGLDPTPVDAGTLELAHIIDGDRGAGVA